MTANQTFKNTGINTLRGALTQLETEGAAYGSRLFFCSIPGAANQSITG